jgi:leucyl-tRNA synthetase
LKIKYGITKRTIIFATYSDFNMADYSKQEIKSIEEKWQKRWEKQGIYKVSAQQGKPKYYVLDMFPYPSGAGLHVGHPLGYIATDIVSRFKRLKGFNVMHPMGFDAFGLPAEQYAIQTGQHPAITTAKNIETYKRQLKQLGFSYDWEREVQTCAPDYYKWTQWIFMQVFNSWYNKSVGNKQDTVGNDLGKAQPISTLIAELEKNGNKNIEAASDEETPIITADDWKSFDEKQKENFLQHYRLAYQSEQVVNWCPALGTVLSNDEVKDGVSERGGYPVERIKMLQWSMRITAYAERLLQGLDTIDWPEAVKEMQRNWIGKSVGAQFRFKILDLRFEIEVFTTRIDTIFGVSFVVLAPEHELVEQITTAEQKAAVDEYVAIAKNRSERERISEVKRVSGVFTGAYAIHPFTNEQLPVWIADYVLAGYGTGAVMAVPGHDERDHRFAKHFNLPIPKVVEGPDVEEEALVSWDAKIINSDFMNGLSVEEAILAGIKKLEEMGIGNGKVNYRMRDAIFGRQRYWGEPFPVYYKDGIPQLVDEKDLPITLPEIDEYKPTETGEPPLGRAKDWKYYPVNSQQSTDDGGESTVDGGLPFELTTMPGWAGSSWYWYRYMDPKNENEFCGKEAQAYWQDVDLYMGGAEHATGHLLYSRFWNKILKDLGYVQAEEPFKKLINQGMIQGSSRFVFRLNVNTSANFSSVFKEKYSSVNPELFVSKKFGDKILNNDLNESEYNLILEAIKKINSNLEFGKYPEAKFGITPITPLNIQRLHVDISLVDGDKLDIERFKNWRDDFAHAEFILEDESGNSLPYGEGQGGAYICGSEIEKMSKSKHNVVNPDDIVNDYGADTLRMYEMFLGPIEQSKPWNTHGIDGVFKFLRRFWNLFHDAQGNFVLGDAAPSKEELKVLHKTLKKVENDIERYSFNTSVSEFMICANELSALKCNKKSILEPLVIALAPFAPHIAEELWEKLGHQTSVHTATYPSWDEKYLIENAFDYPVSINGKTRTFINFPLDMPKEDMEKQVLANEIVLKWTEGKPPKKVIIVQNKIVNVVL